MKQDEIIEMTRGLGICELTSKPKQSIHYSLTIHQMEAFAKLVAAKERDACANLCWKNKDDNAFVNAYNGKRLDLLCADLIKARGESWE